MHNPGSAMWVTFCVVAACVTVWCIRPGTPLSVDASSYFEEADRDGQSAWVKTFCPPSFQALADDGALRIVCEEWREGER